MKARKSLICPPRKQDHLSKKPELLQNTKLAFCHIVRVFHLLRFFVLVFFIFHRRYVLPYYCILEPFTVFVQKTSQFGCYTHHGWDKNRHRNKAQEQQPDDDNKCYFDKC